MHRILKQSLQWRQISKCSCNTISLIDNCTNIISISNNFLYIPPEIFKCQRTVFNICKHSRINLYFLTLYGLLIVFRFSTSILPRDNSRIRLNVVLVIGTVVDNLQGVVCVDSAVSVLSCVHIHKFWLTQFPYWFHATPSLSNEVPFTYVVVVNVNLLTILIRVIKENRPTNAL